MGAGPIGLEAALYAQALGHDVSVYERDKVGANVERWGFVRLFSPWKLNVSPLGLAALRGSGQPTPPPEAYPTGRELCQSYLEPIALALGDRVIPRTEVLAIGRHRLTKMDSPGGQRRVGTPFRLLLRGPQGEYERSADVVIDATGVYDAPNALGDGGIPAVGESALEATIDRHLVDILGRDRDRFAGKTTLLVGAGFGAATSLAWLLELATVEPATQIAWVRRTSSRDPFPLYTDDPLPERARLARDGNRAAANPPPGLTCHPGAWIKRLLRVGSRLGVELSSDDASGKTTSLVVDRVLALVGYQPDTAMTRELQIHQCYASEGPMALAAALLGASGGDCLKQASPGAATLRTTEPGFFVIGHKSHGRRSDFLLRVGREQVRDIFRLLEGSPDLDLYTAPW